MVRGNQGWNAVLGKTLPFPGVTVTLRLSRSRRLASTSLKYSATSGSLGNSGNKASAPTSGGPVMVAWPSAGNANSPLVNRLAWFLWTEPWRSCPSPPGPSPAISADLCVVGLW